jgi:hypothetical protein
MWRRPTCTPPPLPITGEAFALFANRVGRALREETEEYISQVVADLESRSGRDPQPPRDRGPTNAGA